MESSPSRSGSKPRHSPKHFPSSPTITDRDVTESEGDSTDSNDDAAPGIAGKEGALLRMAEELIYMRTLFMNPFPRVVALNLWVVEVWGVAQEVLGNATQSEKSRGLVRRYLYLFESLLFVFRGKLIF